MSTARRGDSCLPCEKERSEEIDIVKRFYGTRSKPVPSVRPPHTPTPGTNSGWSFECEVSWLRGRSKLQKRLHPSRRCAPVLSDYSILYAICASSVYDSPDRVALDYTWSKAFAIHRYKGSLPDTASLKTALNSFIRIITELRSTYVRTICMLDRFPYNTV